MPKSDPSASKTCSRCEALFECRPGAIADCHCNTIPLSFEETRFIAAQFQDCLCNPCLRELKQQFHAAQKPAAIFSWSGGKDSAFCLHQVLSEGRFDVKYLLTTVNDTFERISMHGVREALLDLQADSIGIPLLKVRVSEGSNAEYEKQMEAVLIKAKAEGIAHVIFGDIFLEDLRRYRESILKPLEMQAVFPLWKTDTTQLIGAFAKLNFRTVLCCVNDAYLDESWLGREITATFAQELPGHVDACGERGEYHTFCYAGPVFKKELAFTAGEKVYKPLDPALPVTAGIPVTKGFWFLDLVPA